MAVKTWEVLRVQYCDRAGCDVRFEAETVYPSDFFSEQAPRVLSHRCSNGAQCAANNQGMCVWSGANPNYDPFQR